ncbi:MAG: undecaprenyldiphospho-muramoylpentapeptide beta-N-acetylglucosaminyltransferase [Lysobacterales bacterium]
MRADRPVLILAGGTGGHIFPGIAVANALASRGVPVVWLGSRHGLENHLVPAAGIALETISVSGLRGKGTLALLAAPYRLLRALTQALAVLRRLRPRAAISFGGFAAGPGGLAAWLTRVPLTVHEQNRIPGLTNRVLARFARHLLAGFPDAFADRAALWVGNPVRAAIAALPPPEQRPASPNGVLRLLVIGGSQGARALNAALPAALARLGDMAIAVRHQCGAGALEATRAGYAEQRVEAEVCAFIDDMAAAYASADLVVCRAGALTLAELCAAGVAAILVPFPAAVDDHQTANAAFLVDAGAALMLPQSTLDPNTLAAAIRTLAGQREQRLAMAGAARALARPDAAARVADLCLEAA